MNKLATLIQKIDGRGYKAYKMLEGKYKFGSYNIFIDHVQADPFATPSRFRVEIDFDETGFPSNLVEIHKTAFEDFLNRRFYEVANKKSRKRGSGKSGLITIQKPSQAILKRNSVEVGDKIKIIFFAGLPAYGRKIIGKEAKGLLLHDLPYVIERSIFFKYYSYEEIEKHVKVAEDADFIRKQLKKRKLVAFIANHSILPRKSGVEEKPLENAIPFKSPESMEVEFDCPNGKIKGMGIKEGVTIIAGGAYHGKSTLLNAIAMGVYNHVAGDGREFVITRDDAVKIRAEDGRYINNVCISPLISNLPDGSDSRNFSTDNASGSTSQAANIMEALEIGSRILLIDEDTSATNLMIRDRKMQELIPKENEPITPFIDMIPAFKKMGVSIIMVASGMGEYFDVADHIIVMDRYKTRDETQRAKKIAEQFKSNRMKEAPKEIEIKYRKVRRDSIERLLEKNAKVKAIGKNEIRFGKTIIDLNYIEQIVEVGQTNAIAHLLKRLPYQDCLKDELSKMEDKFIKILPETGTFAMPRKYEVASAINRIRGIIFDDCRA